MIQRGEIWWAGLSRPAGSAPGFRRPVLVVRSDAFNRSAIGTVTVAAITANVRLARAPGNVHLTRRQSKLPKTSVVNVSQLLTIDRSVLTERVSRLSPERIADVDAGLRLALSLPGTR